MPDKFNYKKEWEKTKVQLTKLGQELGEIAKKSEKELVKFSEKSKLHIDSTALVLKLEKLYHDVGKEYIKCKDPAQPSAKLKKLIQDVEKVEKQQQALKRKLKKPKKKAPKKA